MRQFIFIVCIFFILLTSVHAGEMYGCLDRNGKRILTDTPQDGMTNCVLQDSAEDVSAGKNVISQKGAGKNRGGNSACDVVSRNMNNARKYLNQASNRRSFELEAGKEDVRKAVDFLNEAQETAGDCQCPSLSTEISEAAQYAQYASREDSVSQFSDLLTRAIRAFNNAQEAFKLCQQ